MIVEKATLDVISGQESEFEKDFRIASKIISSMNGYISHQILRCIEKRNRYLLIVNWEKLEDHEIGFRTSEEYIKWKNLLHHYYDPFPTVEHYEKF